MKNKLSILSVAGATLLIFGCGEQAPVSPESTGNQLEPRLVRVKPPRPKALFEFGEFVGAPGAEINIRGLPSLTADLRKGEARLGVDKVLFVELEGLVLRSTGVPPDRIRAALSCITIVSGPGAGYTGTIVENIFTQAFPCDEEGACVVREAIATPSPCMAPIVFGITDGVFVAVSGLVNDAS